LSKEEVEKMKKDAQAHASDDRKKKEEIDLRNQADTLSFQTEKQLKEFGDKVSAEARGKVESANEKLKEAIKSNNVPSIKSAMDALNSAWNEASSQMYQQATASGQSGPGAQQQGPTGSEDGKKVEDAQYEVVDDKNKQKS
ncbi:MAG: dnaK, partial [Bacteroidetes bacterium]|nr:dnaK [Bacteroidota bacterium]